MVVRILLFKSNGIVTISEYHWMVDIAESDELSGIRDKLNLMVS